MLQVLQAFQEQVQQQKEIAHLAGVQVPGKANAPFEACNKCGYQQLALDMLVAWCLHGSTHCIQVLRAHSL